MICVLYGKIDNERMCLEFKMVGCKGRGSEIYFVLIVIVLVLILVVIVFVVEVVDYVVGGIR